MSPILTVFLYGLITALATGLGALPFLLLRDVSPRAVAFANAVAGGLMLGASFGIIAEGTGYGAWQTLAGGLIGVLFILATQRWLGSPDAALVGAASADTRRMALIVIVMTVHSFAEGVAVGVSFGGGPTLALAITLAIAVHNVPEGLAISAVLRPRGKTVLACAGWAIFSSLPQPIMAVPAFLFVETFRAALPYGLGFAAGAMVFMVLEELLPEAYDRASRSRVAVVVSLTMVGMVLFQQKL
ncbi:MAG: ZIP family metal transporter [Gemmatimonadota bacterium]|nr:ZIP family metal transporter [Gemmatimonadota bacterium]